MTSLVGDINSRFIDVLPENGSYQKFDVNFDWQFITVKYLSDNPTREGTVTITIDGDDLGGGNTINLQSSTSLDCSGIRAYCTMETSGVTSPLRVFFRT